jgi:hypothetical protein
MHTLRDIAGVLLITAQIVSGQETCSDDDVTVRQLTAEPDDPTDPGMSCTDLAAVEYCALRQDARQLPRRATWARQDALELYACHAMYVQLCTLEYRVYTWYNDQCIHNRDSMNQFFLGMGLGEVCGCSCPQDEY